MDKPVNIIKRFLKEKKQLDELIKDSVREVELESELNLIAELNDKSLLIREHHPTDIRYRNCLKIKLEHLGKFKKLIDMLDCFEDLEQKE